MAAAAMAAASAAVSSKPLAPSSLVSRAEPLPPLTERMRMEAARKLAHDEELEDIERELRRDLHGRGCNLSWDTVRAGAVPLAVRPLEQHLGLSAGAGAPRVVPSAAPPAAKVVPSAAPPAAYATVAGTRAAAGVAQAAADAAPAAPPGMVGRQRSASDDFGDDFGEDDGSAVAACQQARALREGHEDKWTVQSQTPFQLSGESCTLTIFHNGAEGLIRFELLKLGTAETLYVTCTDEYFDELCKEQQGLKGPAQVDAAVKALFLQALDEQAMQGAGADDAKRRSATSILGEDDAAESMGRLRRKSVTDDFGAEDPAEVASHKLVQRRASASDSERWTIECQEAFQLGNDRCTLTILTNKQGLIRFEALKLDSADTLYITCTSEQFDALCDEQKGLSGPARVTAATRQLFQEAMSELEQGSPAKAQPSQQASEQAQQAGKAPRRQSTTDSFGEDDDDSNLPTAQRSLPQGQGNGGNADDKWHVQSQTPWQLGDEKCTLTIFENRPEGLIRFEVLKLSSADTLHVTCTDDYFDELCEEQTGLKGPVRINAAIQRLFQQAMQEHAATGASEAEQRRPPGTAESVGHLRRKSSTDTFGIEDPTEVANHTLKQRHTSNDDGWHVESQEPFQLEEEQCTLTILTNNAKGLIRFEALKLRTAETLYITCTNEKFDSLINEQTGRVGPAKVTAATRQLFREALASPEAR